LGDGEVPPFSRDFIGERLGQEVLPVSIGQVEVSIEATFEEILQVVPIVGRLGDSFEETGKFAEFL
jgi:hypothetical protein